MRGAADRRRLRAATALAALAACAYLQIAKLLAYFQHPSNLFDESKRLHHVDFPTLEYQMESARQFFDAHGALWGYDPFFLSGYPLTFLWNSNVFLQVVAVAASALSNAQILKLVFVAIVCVEPFLVFAALRNFGFDRRASALGTWVALLYLKIAQPVMLLVIGVLTGYLVFPVFLYAWSLMVRISRGRDGLRSRLLLPLVLATAMLVHKTFFILVLPVCAVVGFELLRTRDYRRVAYFCACFAGALAANLFWIAPSIRMAHHLDFSFNAFFRSAEMIREVEVLTLINNVAAHWMRASSDAAFVSWWGLVNGTYLLLLLMAGLLVAGCLRDVLRRRWFELAVVAAPVAAAAFLIFRGGDYEATIGLHGVRFYYCIGLLLLPTLASGVCFALDWAGEEKARMRSAASLGALASLLVLWLPSYETVIADDVRLHSSTLFQRSPLFAFDTDRLALEALELQEWLVQSVPRDEVVFLSTHPGNHYLAGLYAGTGIRFASAPYNHVFLEHNYVNRYFQDYFRSGLYPRHMWGGRSPFNRGDYRFAEIARFFAIRWWVIDRDGSDVDLRNVDHMEHVHSIGAYEIFRWDVPLSDVWLGDGEVEVGYDAITIRNARPSNGEILLNLHWFEEMSVSGADAVLPFQRPGYPVPFIRILNPEATVSVKLAPSGLLFDRGEVPRVVGPQ